MQAFHWFIMIHFCKIKLQQWIITYKSGTFCLQKWIIIYKSGSLFTKVDHFVYKSGSLSRVTHATFSLVDPARHNTGNLIGPTVGISGFRPLGTKNGTGHKKRSDSTWALYWARILIGHIHYCTNMIGHAKEVTGHKPFSLATLNRNTWFSGRTLDTNSVTWARILLLGHKQ